MQLTIRHLVSTNLTSGCNFVAHEGQEMDSSKTAFFCLCCPKCQNQVNTARNCSIAMLEIFSISSKRVTTFYWPF